jgi:hypothetical protein
VNVGDGGFVVLPLEEYRRLVDLGQGAASETALKPAADAAEGLALAVELLAARVHAMPTPGDDPEPLVRFLVTIGVSALGLLPDRGEAVLRDLGLIAAQLRSGPPD